MTDIALFYFDKGIEGTIYWGHKKGHIVGAHKKKWVNPNFCGKRDFCETGGSIRAGRVNDSSGSFGNRRRDVG